MRLRQARKIVSQGVWHRFTTLDRAYDRIGRTYTKDQRHAARLALSMRRTLEALMMAPNPPTTPSPTPG